MKRLLALWLLAFAFFWFISSETRDPCGMTRCFGADALRLFAIPSSDKIKTNDGACALKIYRKIVGVPLPPVRFKFMKATMISLRAGSG